MLTTLSGLLLALCASRDCHLSVCIFVERHLWSPSHPMCSPATCPLRCATGPVIVPQVPAQQQSQMQMLRNRNLVQHPPSVPRYILRNAPAMIQCSAVCCCIAVILRCIGHAFCTAVALRWIARTLLWVAGSAQLRLCTALTSVALSCTAVMLRSPICLLLHRIVGTVAGLLCDRAQCLTSNQHSFVVSASSLMYGEAVGNCLDLIFPIHQNSKADWEQAIASVMSIHGPPPRTSPHQTLRGKMKSAKRRLISST